MIRGKRAEKEYAKLYKNVRWPTEEEDYSEHWDVEINGIKIDVKAIKKDDENIHFVEFKNVLGKKGWLYGDADGFAFETKDYWIEVKKDDLQEIMYQGIMRYDALRKQRKQEKRKVQHQQRQQQQVLNTIQKANGVPKLGGHYGNCFNLSYSWFSNFN